MPELPEVETVRRGLEPVLAGAVIEKVELRRKDLRYPFPKDFAGRLEGRRVEALRRRAKYLIADLDGGDALVMHLGMSGSFRIERGGEPAPLVSGADRAHDHVVFQVQGGARVVYNDPRRFGFMRLIPESDLAGDPIFTELGIDPLGPGMSAEALAAALARRKAPLKSVLSDQRIVAGLGNIYVCEALHLARLSPFRAAETLVTAQGKPAKELVRLTKAIREVLRDAIAAGGSSLRNHRQTNGELGYFQHHFRAYDREGEPCPTPGCRGKIERVAQGGRSTFFCPSCQK